MYGNTNTVNGIYCTIYLQFQCFQSFNVSDISSTHKFQCTFNPEYLGVEKFGQAQIFCTQFDCAQKNRAQIFRV